MTPTGTPGAGRRRDQRKQNDPAPSESFSLRKTKATAGAPVKRSCAVCRKDFHASNGNAKYCGATCRSRAARSAKAPAAKPARNLGDLIGAVTAELEAAGKLDTSLGAQAITLARTMVSGDEYQTVGGLAALSKELRAVMAEALATAVTVTDPLDELKARRDAKRSAG